MDFIFELDSLSLFFFFFRICKRLAGPTSASTGNRLLSSVANLRGVKTVLL